MSRPEYSFARSRTARTAMSVGALWLWATIAVPGQPPDTYRQKIRTFHTAEEFARTAGGKVLIQRRVDPQREAAVRRLPIHLPDTQFTVLNAESASVTWIGTRQGAIRLRRDQHTRWGWWGPDAIWEDPDETGLRALHILSHLRVALHVTGNAQYRARYQAAYDDLVTTHKYHWLTRNQKIMVPGHINHSDDELAFLSYYPLLRYETDSKLLDVYRQSLERSWQIERPERNPLWNVILRGRHGRA